MIFKRLFKAVLTLVLLAILVKSINEFSFYIGRLLYSNLSHWDPENAYLLISIHHVVQALVALLLILGYSKARGISFERFGFQNRIGKQELGYVLFFAAVWAVIQVTSGIIAIKLYSQTISFGFPISIKNAIGHLAFQLLLSGTSEEIIFRALVITVLADVLKNDFGSKNLTIILIFFTTLIFMFDHINFDYSTLTVTHFNLLQQLTLLVFGLFYGWLFIKYRNYWSVAIAHNLLNVVIVVSGLLLYYFL